MKSDNVKHYLPLDVLRGLFKDIVAAFPNERKNCEKDLERVLRNFEHRGFHSLILELSMVDTILLEGLKSGSLPHTDGEYLFTKGAKEPVFLQGLWRLVFNDGKLRVDADPNAIFFIRCVSSFFKKSDIPPKAEKLKEKFDEFKSIECDLRPFGSDWDTNSNRYNVDTIGIRNYAGSFFQNLDSTVRGNEDLLETCQFVADYFAELVEGEYIKCTRLGQLAQWSKHGNGAVAEGSRLTDKYDVETANQSILDNFESDLFFDRLAKQTSSKVMAVPKDGRGPRLIAAEPTYNMWVQQGLLEFFKRKVFAKNLLGHFVDLTDQSLSQEAAKNASISGREATLDLSSASDRLSCDLVHKIFRCAPKFRKALFDARTQTTEICGETIKLAKFATQGSATTFPLQCYIFTIISIAATMYSTVLTDEDENPVHLPLADGSVKYVVKRIRGRVRTFGDDIILPSDAACYAIRILTLSGLKVNTDKSFTTGPFRESCGGDYFLGNNVTPVRMRTAYVTNKSVDVQALIDFSNNLFLKGLWNASSACLRHAYRIDPRSASLPFTMVGL